MRYLFYSSGLDVDLAKAELMALLETYGVTGRLKKIGRIFVLETQTKSETIERICDRSVLFKVCGRLLFDTTLIRAQKDFAGYKWRIGMPFCARVLDVDASRTSQTLSKDFGSLVWKALEAQGVRPKVSLDKPKSTIYILLNHNKVYVTELLWMVRPGRFEKREPQHRPVFHPSSLKPRLARLLVNLSGAKRGQRFLDPFCGVGGILIEAGLIGAKLLGTDFDWAAVQGASKNLRFLKLEDFEIKQGDAASIDVLWRRNSIDAIATDPPYGRASHVEAQDIRELYHDFLESSWHLLKAGKRLAMLHPDNIRLTVPRVKYDIVARGDWYVHGGLTRKILVLRKL